jgi:hypothetical protein
METLLLNVKNNVISHQAFMRKTKREKINSLRKDLMHQKKDYVLNQVRILQLEQELNNLIDWEMRSKLTSFQHFEILNGEKMTPRFLTLAKITNKNCSLDSIAKPDGSALSPGGRERDISSTSIQISTRPQKLLRYWMTIVYLTFSAPLFVHTQ